MSKGIPYEQYRPGQFADIAAEPFAEHIWRFLSTAETIESITAVAHCGKSPIEAVGAELHERFGKAIEALPYDTDRVRTMVNNMVKQIMERQGYRLSACTLLRDCPFCSSSGLYTRAPIPPAPSPGYGRGRRNG